MGDSSKWTLHTHLSFTILRQLHFTVHTEHPGGKYIILNAPSWYCQDFLFSLTLVNWNSILFSEMGR